MSTEPESCRAESHTKSDSAQAPTGDSAESSGSVAPRPGADAEIAEPPVFSFKLLESTLSGVPELELFENETARRRALAAIGRKAGNPRSGGFWSGLFLFVDAIIIVSVGLAWLLRRWAVPPVIGMPLVLVFCGLAARYVLRHLHRDSMPAMLREELLLQRVPVCLACGYGLRGLPAATQRCPECGKPIAPRVRRVMEEVSGNGSSRDGSSEAVTRL